MKALNNRDRKVDVNSLMNGACEARPTDTLTPRTTMHIEATRNRTNLVHIGATDSNLSVGIKTNNTNGRLGVAKKHRRRFGRRIEGCSGDGRVGFPK